MCQSISAWGKKEAVIMVFEKNNYNSLLIYSEYFAILQQSLRLCMKA